MKIIIKTAPLLILILTVFLLTPQVIAAGDQKPCFNPNDPINPGDPNLDSCTTTGTQTPKLTICKNADYNPDNPNTTCIFDPSKVPQSCNKNKDDCSHHPTFLQYSCSDDELAQQKCVKMVSGADLTGLTNQLQNTTYYNSTYGPLAVKTPFGYLNPEDLSLTAGQLIKLSTGLAGLLALALILIGAFGVMTSSGQPDKLTESKETITSAIIGLSFIILTITIITVIGKIFQLPGLF